MPRKSKSKKDEYDKNGHWVQERNRIKGAIRRVFRLFPQMKDVLNEARVELPPALKKDGTPGKRPQVRFKCAVCNELFSRKNVQVDHIEPVVPLHKSEAQMSYDEIVRGICCSRENLQVVCSTPMKRNGGKPSCHKIKTDEENYVRKRLQEDSNISIDWLKEEFKQYLVKKEEDRLAREKRKAEREAKRQAKENEKRQRNSRKGKKT
jgi:hypothetical protein